MKYLLILFIFIFSSSSFAKDHDPNNYFKDRKWSVDAGKSGKLMIETTYVAEPVSSPNHLNVKLKCPKSKRSIAAIKNFKHCGIDAISVQGNKIEVLIVDYDANDSRGYCMKKRKKLFPLPKCK